MKLTSSSVLKSSIDQLTSHPPIDSEDELLHKQANYLNRLLSFENDVRQITDKQELHAHLCNSTRGVLAFKQSFYGTVDTAKNRFRLQSASSIPVIDREAPFIQWLEQTIDRLLMEATGERQQAFCLTNFCARNDQEGTSYLYKEFLWTPQLLNGELVGGFLTARDTPWQDSEKALATRLAHLYLHAVNATEGSKHIAKVKQLSKSKYLGGSLLLLIAVGFIINLPVKDSLVIEEGARVQIFLDSNPLNPIEAVLTSADYSATVDKRDVLSYTLDAKLENSDNVIPRIGVEGTALVYGEEATLAYTILRRPLSAFRQLIGW